MSEKMFDPVDATIHFTRSRTLDARSRVDLVWKQIHPDMLTTVGEPPVRALVQASSDRTVAEQLGYIVPKQ